MQVHLQHFSNHWLYGAEMKPPDQQMSGWLSLDCRCAVECIPPSSEVGSAARLVVPGPQLRTQRRAVERPPAALTPPPPRTPALPAPPRPATCAQLCLWPHIGRTALSGDLNTGQRGGRDPGDIGASRDPSHGATMADQFCLKWNNYQLSLTSAFKHILEEEEFVDVTLSAGGQNLKAHKVVLSACSSYFRDLLRGISLWQHPVLVLRDVQFLELQSILEFVYLGEVNVEQDRLESFLKTAELLRIKGLTDGLQDRKEAAKPPPPPTLAKPVNKEAKTPPKLPILKPASGMKNNNTKRPMTALNIEEIISAGEMMITPPKESPELRPAKTIKLDDVIIPQQHAAAGEEVNYEELTEDDIEENGEHIVVAGDPVTTEDLTNISEDFSDTDSYKDLSIADCDEAPQVATIGADGKEFLGPLHKRCPHCQMVMLKKNLSRHIRDQHSMDRPRSTCPICTKSYKTPDWLKDHIRRGHGYTKEATDDLLAKMAKELSKAKSPVITPVKAPPPAQLVN